MHRLMCVQAYPLKCRFSSSPTKGSIDWGKSLDCQRWHLTDLEILYQTLHLFLAVSQNYQLWNVTLRRPNGVSHFARRGVATHVQRPHFNLRAGHSDRPRWTRHFL